MKRIYLIFFVLLFILGGCAVQKEVVRKKPTVIKDTPAGLEMETVLKADSIFSTASVTEADEKRAQYFFEQAQEIANLADSLWLIKDIQNFTHNDSIRTFRFLSQAEKYVLKNFDEFKLIKKMMKKTGRLNREVITRICKELIQQTIKSFEQAITTNKFEYLYRHRFGLYLKNVAEKLKDNTYLARAGRELELAVKDVKNIRAFFSELGIIYFDLKDWQNSFKNYDIAKNILRKTTIFSIDEPDKYYARLDEVPVDTAMLVSYLNYQAECKTKLYEATPALALFREAQKITPSIELKQIFQNRLDWILWDDGNIRASEIRDHADSLRYLKKEYSNAKNVYLGLLPVLWTKRTNDEINWSIANIDFNNLNNKEAGADRMMIVIKNSSKDSLSGAPVDSAYQRYFNTYGRMCFNLGQSFLESDLEYSYIYFAQAAEINYDGRGQAFLQLSDMSKFDANETIKLCQQTMDYIDDLKINEKKMLYKLLHTTYRKLGDFQTSKKWFDKWKDL